MLIVNVHLTLKFLLACWMQHEEAIEWSLFCSNRMREENIDLRQKLPVLAGEKFEGQIFSRHEMLGFL